MGLAYDFKEYFICAGIGIHREDIKDSTLLKKKDMYILLKLYTLFIIFKSQY